MLEPDRHIAHGTLVKEEDVEVDEPVEGEEVTPEVISETDSAPSDEAAKNEGSE